MRTLLIILLFASASLPVLVAVRDRLPDWLRALRPRRLSPALRDQALGIAGRARCASSATLQEA